MTEQELKDFLQQHQWSLSTTQLVNQKAFSAKRRVVGTKSGYETKYLCTEQKLRHMTEKEILTKLNQPPRTQQS